MRSRTAITVALVLLAASALPILSQTAPASSGTAEQEPNLRLEVRRIPVDVVVLDKQGNPVKGLTAADFEVKEGGEVQAIKSFDVTDGSAASYTPPKLPTLPANTFVNIPDTPERGPLYILYFDMTNTTPDEQMSSHKELLGFVENAQPDTRMMLILNTDRIHILQGFTTDHDLIEQAILGKGPGPHVPQVFTSGNNYGRWDARAALGNLNWIAEYMSGIPGRKNLIWLSSEFPIPVSPSLVGSNAMASGGAPANPSAGGGGPQMLDLSGLLADAMKTTYANMMKSQIALYPVDLGGSTGNLVKFDQMDMIAQSTGGRAYYSNNHISELIDKAVVHGESYYTLTYAPQKDFDGDARHIQVKLVGNHPDLQVTYRTLYYAVADDDKALDTLHKKDVIQERFLKAKAEDTLYANMEHGAPMVHDLLFSAHLTTVGKLHMASDAEMAALQDSPAFFRTRKPNSKPLRPPPAVHLQKYSIEYAVIDPELRRIESVPGTAPTIEFAVSAFTNEGATLNCVLNQGSPAGAGAAADANGKKQGPVFRAEQELEVPENATYIRVAVRDMTTNRTGTLEATLPLKPEKQMAQKN
ncbi:VWA domain-containing protein [Terracidiphilus sp.]|jgi:VWFA-related protein|uniref:VWA domain-containing protein n=1 Tax=Terracidiphilus sp. TaxID=1964191 RepID=UPI003C29B5D0